MTSSALGLHDVIRKKQNDIQQDYSVYQSTESADGSGCLKFYRHLVLTEIYAEIKTNATNKCPFWYTKRSFLVFSRIATLVTLLTQHCRFCVLYWSSHVHLPIL